MTNALKKLVAALTVLVLTMSFLAATGLAAESAHTGVYRIYGQDRYETAFQAADRLKEELGLERFDTVVVASGKNFPDALTGSYLAVQNHAPILMTKGTDLTALKSYLENSLKPGGKVYILGGTGAVPASVDAALSQYQVIRLQGSTRYETNLQILRQIPQPSKTLLVCDGGSFADSLSASATNLPILLVNGKTNRLSDSQKAYLRSLGEVKLCIIGGEKAVSQALETELKAYGQVSRIGGATRVETSALLARTFFSEPQAAVLAYSLNFPDGLCGGPLAYAMGGPVLLTKAGAEEAAKAFVQEKNIQTGIVLGGKGLVSDTSARRIFSLSASERIRIWPKRKIEYVLNGGENSPENPSQYEQEVEVYLKNATRTGCSFSGWFLDADFKTRIKTVTADMTGDLTLYAKWTPKSYPVNYYLDGGENNPENPTTYTYGQSITLAEPTRNNYVFKGWYLDSAFTTQADGSTPKAGGNLKLYARWEFSGNDSSGDNSNDNSNENTNNNTNTNVGSYTVSYILNGGENSPENPAQYTKGKEVYLKNATRVGCSFGGWFLDSDFTTRIKTVTADMTGDLTLYAKWTPKSYPVNYYLDGGLNSPENPTSYTYGQSITLAEPTKANYVFKGWYLDSAFTTQADGSTPKAGGNLKLYARWEPSTYSVSYALNGGENSTENPAAYIYGQRITLASPTKANYTFKGWYLEDTFTTRVYNITTSTPGNLTLHARWSPNNYKVYYVMNGGKNDPENPTEYTYGQSVSLKAPTRANYRFVGWYLDSAFTVEMDGITPETAGKLTLYAKWEINSYEITYVLSGGENSPGNPTAYTYGQSISLASPTRVNYLFLGWYLDDAFSTRVESITKDTSGDLTLYAWWEPCIYKINYILNGGENSLDNPDAYGYGDSYPLWEPFRANWQFKGWYLDETFTTRVYSITPTMAGELTLYALWEGDSYAIRYVLNGGENSPENPTAYNYGTVLTLKSPTREGYVFAGWYRDRGLTQKVESIGPDETGYLTLFASWQPE